MDPFLAPEFLSRGQKLETVTDGQEAGGKTPFLTRLLYAGLFTHANWTVYQTFRDKQTLRNLMLFIGLSLITWKIPSTQLIARLLQRLYFKAVKKCDIRVKTYIQGKLLEK